MTWGLGQVTGRTRHVLPLAPLLFALHPAWVLFQIFVHQTVLSCGDRTQEACIAIPATRNPAFTRAEISLNAFQVLFAIGMSLLIFYVLRAKTKESAVETELTRKIRLVHVAIALVLLACYAFRH